MKRLFVFRFFSAKLPPGELLFAIKDAEAFEPYEDYLNNFCYMLAVILEERLQRSQNAQRTEDLKKLTTELEAQNVKLQEAYRELEMETAERVQILEMLRDNERLLVQQNRMAAMGDMLGNIAHQWRQPLNVLGLKIQELGISLKHGDFSEEILNENIAKTMEIVQHLSKTITTFQDFLRLNKAKIPFKVDQVIAKTVSLVDDGYKSLNIVIDISTTGDPQIFGYPNEYGQVLLNLLANSRDAFLEHGVSDARITVRSWGENDKTVVTVTDNAGGINEGIIDKIFDAYFTTKELGKGTGLRPVHIENDYRDKHGRPSIRA